MKVPKQNCVAGITSAQNSFQPGSVNSLKTRASLFESRDKPSKETTERIAELEQLVGRLSVAMDIQKKALMWLSENGLKNEE